ncbi:hypothetical protein CsatA_015627 [Cannabis sativa]
MADTAKYVPVHGGGTMISDFRSLFSIIKPRRTFAFLFGFMLAFVVFTGFLVFNPSPNSGAPWFSNVFSVNTPTPTRSSSDSPGSQFPSVFSYFFPNNYTSEEIYKVSSPPPPPPTSLPSPPYIETNSTRSNNATLSSPAVNIGTPNSENRTKTSSSPQNPEISTKNQTSVGPSGPTSNASSPSYSGHKNQTQVPENAAEKNPSRPTVASPGNPPAAKNQSVSEPKPEKNSGKDEKKSSGPSSSSGEVSKKGGVLNNTAPSKSSSEQAKKIDIDYDSTVEFFVAPFLVQEWEMKDKNGTKRETLRLDLVGKSFEHFKTADIIVFNTGHWWTHDKTSKGEDYYQEGSHVYKELNVLEAFRKAITTWGRWIDSNVNPKKSLVFFRGYSHSHFSGGQWNSGGACDSETVPISDEKYLRPYPDKMTVLENVFKGMKTQVTYLNVTRLTDFRKDGHPSIYRKQKLTAQEQKTPLLYQDCSHWCLPGVPDAWNELLYAELLVKLSHLQQQQHKRT